MAYKTEEFKSIGTLSLTEGCELIKSKFKSEKEFTKNLLPKLERIIKEAYNLTIDKIELEKYFKYNHLGLYNMFADIYITTKEGRDILIECKNPKHNKCELFNALGQMISYDFLLKKTRLNPIIILATSVFDFHYFEIIKMYNLNLDLIINNENLAAFWVNEFK